MDYTTAKNVQSVLENQVEVFSKMLNAYPKGDMGLTPDVVKATPQWKADKAGYNLAMTNLRAYNSTFLKTYKAEIKAERRARR